MNIREYVQTTLDTALFDDGVRVYWQRKAQTDGEDPDEYVVYTLDGDPAMNHADDKPLIRAGNVAIRYYYRDTLLDTFAGREQIAGREIQISAAVIAAGFVLPNGYFDSGDIDSIGFGTTIFDCDYWRVV